MYVAPMRIQLSFKSGQAAGEKLRAMADEVEKNGSAQERFFLDEPGPDSELGLEVVDEASDEFEEPSASIMRDI